MHLVGAVKRELVLARRASRRSGRAERRFAILDNWDTRDGWAKPRKVVAKAEWTEGKANPRFIVTSLHWSDGDARKLYEKILYEGTAVKHYFIAEPFFFPSLPA